MRKLEKGDKIESLGGTPLEDEFPKGHTATVKEVKEAPSASGESIHQYQFESQAGSVFHLSHDQMEEAVEREWIKV